MDTINAIIVSCPSAHETTLYTRQPRRRTRQERRESIVSIMTILIPRQQLLSQERQTQRHKRDERKTKKRHSTQVTADRSGKIMPQISRDERGFNNKTYKTDFASKTKKRSHRDTYAMCHTRRSLDKPRPESPGRATDDRP
jgi:hypothetical protein